MPPFGPNAAALAMAIACVAPWAGDVGVGAGVGVPDGEGAAACDDAGADDGEPVVARAVRAASGRPADPPASWLGRSVLFAATASPGGPACGPPIIRYPTKASAIRTAATPKTSMNAGRRCQSGRERSSSSSRLVAETGPRSR
jgi:hypothetical protein